MGMLIAAIIVALLIVILALQNAGAVTLHFLFLQAEMPLVIVIICSVLLGVLLVGAILMAKKLRDKKMPDKLERVVDRAKRIVKREDEKKSALPAESDTSLPDAAPSRDETTE